MGVACKCASTLWLDCKGARPKTATVFFFVDSRVGLLHGDDCMKHCEDEVTSGNMDNHKTLMTSAASCTVYLHSLTQLGARPQGVSW